MPHFRLETNVPADKVPASFVTDTIALVSEMLGKPLEYCVATIIPGMQMAWGNDVQGPCGIATLMSIGKLGVNENDKYSALLSAHVFKNLGIPQDKMYISFVDAMPSYVGFNGHILGDRV